MRHTVILKRKFGLDVVRRFLGKTGYEYSFLTVIDHGSGNAEDMLLCLARAVYDLRYALTYAAVKIDLRIVAYFLKRLHFKLERRVVRAYAAVCHVVQQFCQFMFIHCFFLSARYTGVR